MGSWFDSIRSFAQDASQRVKHFAEDLFPDFSKLPIVSNPVVLMVKGSDALMQSVVAASNDFNIKREGIEPFAKLPDNYMPPDEQQSSDIQSRSVATLVTNYAQATASNVADGVRSVIDAVTPSPGSMPLWVKATVAGAVVIGTVVALQSLMNGGRRAS